jgi:hypothetical protein
MPLFKTIDEIKKYVSANLSSNIKTLLPDINQAEETYIKKYLGKEQYDALLTAYTAATADSPLSAIHQNLLEKCQMPLANLAYADFSIIGQVDMSDEGIRIVTDDSHKTAFQWQINDLRNDYFLKKGFNGLEALLSFLEENKDAYPTWKGSSAYTQFKEYFINSAAEFNKYYRINESRLTFLALETVMRTVEDFKIRPALSDTFFDEIKTAIKSGAALSDDHKKVMTYIVPAVAHLTIAAAIDDLSVEFIGNAFVINQYSTGQASNTKSTAQAELLGNKQKQAKQKGETYLKDLKDYLNKVAAADKYASYFNSESYTAPSSGDKTVITNTESNKIYRAF